MPLTVKKVESAKSTQTLRRIADSNGLCLEIPPSGKKRWRLRYRVNGKQKMVSLGTYPEVSLKEARKKRDVLRLQIQESVDPAKSRKEKKLRSKASSNTHLKQSRLSGQKDTIRIKVQKLVLLT